MVWKRLNAKEPPKKVLLNITEQYLDLDCCTNYCWKKIIVWSWTTKLAWNFFSQIPGQQYNTQIPGETVREEFKIIKLDKIPAKYLVWQAICSCGQWSAIFIATGTVNADICIEDTINLYYFGQIWLHATIQK